MAPLPSNNTAVTFVDYSCEGEDHTIQMRHSSGASVGDALATIDAFLTALGTNIYLLTITGARERDISANVTYPVTWPGAATYGSSTEGNYASAQYGDFIGRSIDGRRCRVAVFGLKGIVDTAGDDFRFPSSVGYVGAALAVLEADGNVPCSISGLPVNWHQYMNAGINAYWRNRIRA